MKVDAEESTVRFYQEVFDGDGRLREVHRSFRQILVIGRLSARNHDHARYCGVPASRHLQRRTTRAPLVDWAERAMMEEHFDDVREFGPTWEDCETYLARLGYETKVDVVQTR